MKYKALICMFLALATGCGGTTTGNPVVTLKSASYSRVAGSFLPSWFPTLITPAYASVSSLTLCFKRLRFKTTYSGGTNGDTTDSTNFDFNPGEVSLSPSGNTLGQINLPAGTYRRIEFKLSKDCTSGLSVQFTNSQSNQTFSTGEDIEIKFEGTFEAAGEAQDLSLQFQNLVTALDSVTSNTGPTGIKAALENVQGGF